ncbi:DUF1045 domain-containing protein [Magnetospira thiophila]
MTDYIRYALYFAPEADSALGRFGNSWLGFDPASGEDLARPDLPGLDTEELQKITVAPARYGFHGTLKPPFVLQVGTTVEDLEAAIQQLAATLGPFEIPALKIIALGSFIALVPDPEPLALTALAASCVKELDPLRAPLSAAALERRRMAGLTPRQDAFLRRWGYPYVLEEFRFHLTLTGPLPVDQRAPLQERLEAATQTFARTPYLVRDICLFGDPGNGARFRLLKRFPFQG